MWIIGCNFHPSWQQVAWFNSESGESGEAKLENGNGEAERWYGQLPVPSLIGLEATGNAQWFVEMLQQLGHEVWVGDAAQIRASMVRKRKTDARDAAHVLELLLSERFPRIWRPTMAEIRSELRRRQTRCTTCRLYIQVGACWIAGPRSGISAGAFQGSRMCG